MKKSYKTTPPFLFSGEKAFAWAKKNVNDLPDDDTLWTRVFQYSYFAHEVYRQGKVKIHRVVEVDLMPDGGFDVSMRCLGKAWSKERGGADVYNPSKARTEKRTMIMIVGEVSPTAIDWSYGFGSFLWYGTEQWEVSLLPNQKVLVTEIDGEAVDPPFAGNSGPAQEEWLREQCERFTAKRS